MTRLFVKTLMLVFLAGMSGVAYAEYEYNNAENRTYDGKVTKVDVAAPSLTVDGPGDLDVTFPITNTTKFKKDIYDIKLSDVNVGDYVTVSYYRYKDQSRKPDETALVTVHYSGSGYGD